jgi:hypothetical protein
VLLIHLHRHTPSHSDDTETENSSLLGRHAVKDAQPLAKVLKEKSGVRDLFMESVRSKNLDTGDRRWLFFFTLLVSAVASSMIIGACFVTSARLDEPARMASSRCGLWVFDGETRPDASTRAGLLDLEKEERAARFAEECYRQPSSIAQRCNFLYRPNLPVSKAVYINDCPFRKEICRQNQTVTFTTPVIDASDIGIHSLTTPKFYRSTTCTPLSMEYPYV